VTRWLWVWFIAFLAFPVVLPTRGPLPISPSYSVASTARASWDGPLAPVIGQLETVRGTRLSKSDLAGKIVLVEYWAFACVNCRRTTPAMKALDHRFRGTDVRVISIHTPELDIERDPAQVADAVAKAGIEYPVALDPDAAAWRAVGNRAWPCLYLLDRHGRVRFRHEGELHEETAAWSDLLRRVAELRSAPI
jgi:thiol-disulfide isomerase/thioredoxin